VNAHLYVEGGESKEDKIRCREGFRRIIEKAGFSGRMPRLSACGGREATFDDFKTAHDNRRVDQYVGLLVDSEDPVANIERPWDHLRSRDGWDKPTDANDEQVLLMTTCMESWIVADRAALEAHYDHNLQLNALPSLVQLEARSRQDVFHGLVHATRNCRNAFSKGRRAFDVLAKVSPNVLREHLPSFARAERILEERL
jgi:hypothetical protein